MEIKIQHQQGQALLNYLCLNRQGMGVRMPMELGRGEEAEKFDDIERVYLDEQIIKLRTLLMSYSLRKSETKEILFGDPENWKLIMDSRSGLKVHDQVDPEAPFTIKLDRDQREGLYWTLLLMAHPSSPVVQPVPVLEEVVWPVARMISADKQLRKHLKLDVKKTRAILWNDDKEWERKDPKKLSLVEDPQKPAESAPATKADA